MSSKTDVDAINAVIKSLSDSIAEVSAYAPFICVKIDDLEISTSNVDSKSNYLMSLTLEKSGEGKANSFTLSVAYVPSVSSRGIHADVNNDFDTLDLRLIGAECEFYYGYCFPASADGNSGAKFLDAPVSPKYVGQILDYDIEINQGMINYTITGYSNLCSLKDIKISKTTDDLYKLAGNTYNPIKLVKGLLEEQIESQKLNYIVVDNVNENDGCGCYDNEDLFKNAITDVSLFEFINSTILPQVRSKNPDQKDVKTTTETEAESGDGSEDSDGDTTTTGGSTESESDLTELVTFTFNVHDYVDDANDGKCRITLDYNDPKKSEPCIDLDFSWMTGKLTDIVQNFTPKFSGSVALASASALKSKLLGDNNDSSSVAVDGDGVMEIIQSYIGNKVPANTGDSSINDIVSAIATMAIFQQQPYTASLTTMGIPVDIPITTHMKLTPLIYGKPHYTAGEYYITKMTDSIGSQGFTSAFELMRVSSSTTSTDDIDSIIKKLTS